MATSSYKRELQIFFVDAFTNVPFGGNPAAVCLLENDQEITDDVKQKLASELNLSETAYVSKIDPRDSFQTGEKFGIRWFSPAVEVSLCGHATIATSAVLFECLGNQNPRLTFETRMSGQVFASRQGSKVVLDFPNLDPKPASEKFMEIVALAACGRPPADVQYTSTKKLLIRLDDTISREELESLSPDAAAMCSASCEQPVNGVILTIKGSEEYDFYSRYFAPWCGLDEDPVCGSAHSVLAPYWSRVLGKKKMTGRQCSKRGGILYVTVRDDGRVDIAGEYKFILKGTVSVS